MLSEASIGVGDPEKNQEGLPPEAMLKGHQTKINPVKLSDEQVANILREQEGPPRPVHRPPPRPARPRSWLTVGAVGTLVTAALLLGLSSIVLEDRGTSEAQAGSQPTPDAEPAPETSAGGQPTVALSVISTPRRAVVYLNEDSIGVTPLLDYTVKPGTWTLSIQKENFASFDTLLVLDDDLSLYYPLETAPPGDYTENPTRLPAPVIVPPISKGTTPVKAEASIQAAAEPNAQETASTAQTSGGTSRRVALDTTPTPASTRAAEAEAARKEAEAREADSLAAQAQRNEQRYQYLAGQSDALFEQGNYEAARATYEEMLALKPNDAYAQERIAESKRLAEEARRAASLAANAEEDTGREEPETPNRTSSSTLADRLTRGSNTTRKAGEGARGNGVSIVEVHGKRTLEVSEIANFRVDTAPSAAPPNDFFWESEAGVFARGRSIDLQFVEKGNYTITVTALNGYNADRVTFDITVKAPSVTAAPSTTREQRPQSRRRRTATQSNEAAEQPTSAPFERSALYSSKGVARDQGGYSWVIATHLHRQVAVSDMVRYRVAGYRTGLFEDNNGSGSIAYRVLIGQFPTEEAALQARPQLPNDIPGGVWLLQLNGQP